MDFIKKLFLQPEEDKSGSGSLFRKLMLQVAVVAIVTHCAFGLLFYIHQVTVLAIVNVFSVAMYVAVYLIIRAQKQPIIAWVLVVSEIVAHAIFAVFLVGWESGFHLYIMLIPPVMMVSPIRNPQVKMFAVTLMMVLYILLDYGLRGAEAGSDVPLTIINSLHYFNLVTVLSLMVFLTGLYYRLAISRQKKLKELATTDSLTGMQNRRSMQYLAGREIENHKRSGNPLSLLLCDLDKFKQVNDRYGHQAGDEVLKVFSALVFRMIRQGDLVARWGGEEFLLLLPGTSAEEALYVAERIRKELEQTPVIEVEQVKVTTTMGICQLTPADDFDSLVSRADEALYKGKDAGRNQVVLA